MTWNDGWSWPTLKMQANRNRLKELRTTLDELPMEPPEVGAHLARFLVVRSTGYIEHTFESCIHNFADAHSHPIVANHVISGLYKGRNARPGTLVDRIGVLSEEWSELLVAYLDDDDASVRRELEYMVDRRNRIAHGESESVNRRKAIGLADVALGLGSFLTDLMDPR